MLEDNLMGGKHSFGSLGVCSEQSSWYWKQTCRCWQGYNKKVVFQPPGPKWLETKWLQSFGRNFKFLPLVLNDPVIPVVAVTISNLVSELPHIFLFLQMQQKLPVQVWTHLVLKKLNQHQDIAETVENQENSIWILQQLLSQPSKLHLLKPAHRSPAVLSNFTIRSLHSSHRAICTHTVIPQRPCSRLSLALSAQKGGDFQWLQSHCDNPLGQLFYL